jgi:hypothetical protein
VNFTLQTLNPVLKDLQPVAPRLGTMLQVLVPAARGAIPTVKGIQSLVPGARKALTELPPVSNQAVPSIKSLTTALNGTTPILAGLRPYTPDVVAGFFDGVGGGSGSNYDANGHYIKSLLTVQAAGGTLTGLLNTLSNLLGTAIGNVTGLNGARTKLLAPCPGGGSPPTATNPWTAPDLLPGTGDLCNPADDATQ